MAIASRIELRDLIDVDFLQEFQDNFAYSTGVAGVIEDEYGEAVTCPSCFSEFCLKFIRSTEIGSKRCRESDVQGMQSAIRTGKPAVYECHAGLIDFAAPIMLKGRTLGAIFGGQVLTKAPDEAKFRRIAKELGVDPDEYIAAVKNIPVISEEKLWSIARVLFSIANTFSEMAYRAMEIKENNRKLVLTNNQLNNILQSMSDGVLMVDHQGIITQVNPSAEKIIGKTAQEMKGSPVKDVTVGKALCIEKMLAKQQSYYDVELMLDTAAGHIYCVSSGKPILDDQGTLNGGVILLRPMEKVQRLVNRFSGAQANFHFRHIIGNSAEIRETVRLASHATSTMSTVLLQGESGTGKEVFAQAIHNRSARRKGPFVAVNCGAIPRELIASELFGYAEGAFTGAKRGGRPGKFELASGGTLFLDEIGDMPLDQQVALLRVLQDKKITRVGGDMMIPVDIRIICATNRDLKQEIEKGRFREDLYYRLNVITIEVPPLRRRREDIPLLVDYFLKNIGRDWGVEIESVEPEVMEYLTRYEWPGNVRELQNVVERMISMADGNTIGLNLLPPEIYNANDLANSQEKVVPVRMGRLSRERQNRKQLLAEKESQEILALLTKHGGNVSQVARDMGVSRNTLYRKMKQYNISD
ncbi:MAG: sigma 54-interacting transcriptional regulator [Bacillota bacterium]|jgi:PAS domain S-box-containing protein|nr:sigma 54-interacting transcriptional regulator [Bacillota bacterium]